jgi:DNA segregation ATPase FtsK/SpoIIIE, S-DNA-T family
MGKKNKKKENKEKGLLSLKQKTWHWIAGILFFTLAFVFVLAALKNAGVMGKFLYDIFYALFGIGYFLFPFIFVLLGVLFLRSKQDSLIPNATIGSVLLFFSGLAFLTTLSYEGGIVGKSIARPLISLFDTYVTLLILAAIFVISFLIIFDATPSFSWYKKLFSFGKKRDKSEDDESTVSEDVDYTDDEEESGEDAEGETDSSDSKKTTDTTHADDTASKKSEKSGGIFTGIFSGKTDGEEDSDAYLLSSSSDGMPYTPPPLSLLGSDKGKPGVGDIKANANIIKRTLQNFGIDVEMDEVSVGPSVTRYALKPAQGVKLSRIVGLQNDLALALAAHPLRIEAPIPGKSLVGIEIPNSVRTTVGLASLLKEKEFNSSHSPLLITLGRSVTGKSYFGNLAKMPHLLVAGATGSGKSVAIHSIIASLLYRNAPDHLRFILIDPKRVELTLYNSIPHLLTPVVTDAKKAILALKWATREMDRRYDILEAESVRDISSYHKNIVLPAYEGHRGSDEGEDEPALPERMPYILVVIDELADIMSTYPRELEAAIVRLAQMSRAVGIHLLLSTQRPSVKIITGLIKANIPARVAFQVASQIDSRTILDAGGAEKLLGAGDMLYLSGEMSKPVRLQSAFTSENEVKQVVKFLAKEYRNTEHKMNITAHEPQSSSIFDTMTNEEKEDDDDDEMYENAREVVIQTGKASTTFLQRKLRLGYARAARLMDLLEERGVVSPQDGSKQREVLIKAEEEGYGE